MFSQASLEKSGKPERRMVRAFSWLIGSQSTCAVAEGGVRGMIEVTPSQCLTDRRFASKTSAPGTTGDPSREIPISDRASNVVADTRVVVTDIVTGGIAAGRRGGPCSIHDVRAALEYGEQLKRLADRFADSLVIPMRSLREAAHVRRVERADQRSTRRRHRINKGSDGPASAARPGDLATDGL